MNWVFISQKATFFIVTAVKPQTIHNLSKLCLSSLISVLNELLKLYHNLLLNNIVIPPFLNFYQANSALYTISS
jgi:hypothetical protein